MSSNNKNAVQQFDSIIVDKLEFDIPTDTKFKSSQQLAFPNYNDSMERLFIQLPNIKLECYGVPARSEYAKEDHQRMFLKLPILDEKLSNFFFELYRKFSTDEYKEKLFG